MATFKRNALLVVAFVIPPAVAGGVTVGARLHGQGGPLDAAPLGDVEVPGPRPPTSRLPLAVVVVGNHGTEITDSLPVVELLAASGAFEVRVVAPERRLSPFATNTAGAAGLDFLPDLGFDDYATLVHRPPALLVVPYLHRWTTDDAAVIPWIRGHVGPATTLLSICQGAELVAASGLFDGFAATANDRMLDTLTARHPGVRWQRDLRWVRDGRRMSSSLLAGGLDATLAAIDALAGRAATIRAATATGYPSLQALDDRTQPRSTIPVSTVLEGAYRWERARVGIAIADGVAESEIAGLLDGYATTYTTDTVAAAARRGVVRTKHGLALVPRSTIDALHRGTRVVVASTGGTGVYGYDVALREIAGNRGGNAGRIAGRLLNYPTAHLDLPDRLPLGGAIALRPLLIGLLGLALTSALTRRRPWTLPPPAA